MAETSSALAKQEEQRKALAAEKKKLEETARVRQEQVEKDPDWSALNPRELSPLNHHWLT